MRLDSVHNVFDVRLAASRCLPRVVFDYVDGGADDETTMRANQTAFDDVVFRPRAGSPVTTPDMSVSILGTKLATPVMLAPCGLLNLIHRDSGVGVARAAYARGTISVLSSLSGANLDDVAGAAPGRVWFQVYNQGDRGIATELLDSAVKAKVDVVVLTIDTAAYGNRERDLRHGLRSPLRLDRHNAAHLTAQILRRPTWTARMGKDAVALMRTAAVSPSSRGPRGPWPGSLCGSTWRSCCGWQR